MATTKRGPSVASQDVSTAIAIIGCGNMGSAIAERLSPHIQLFLYDHNPAKVQLLVDKGFGKAVSSIPEALANAHQVILAFKPQSLTESASVIQNDLTADHTLVSILSSTSLHRLKKLFPHCRIVRMMPNIALLCGQGMIALCCEDSDRAFIEQQIGSRFDPLGRILWLPESKIDAFTALAGSGPAFIFALTEAIVDAGIAMGFPAKEAQAIVYQMLRGSVELMETSAKHPGELKWLVTSPAGTTIAGLVAFEEHAVRSGIIKTFLATYQKTLSL